ncbi:hypothetical protein FQA39_LY04994 [Lamprigera yunnana]|nr:hypothetical protein FQA39_LY04994 [Lamprigera yunnana]
MKERPSKVSASTVALNITASKNESKNRNECFRKGPLKCMICDVRGGLILSCDIKIVKDRLNMLHQLSNARKIKQSLIKEEKGSKNETVSSEAVVVTHVSHSDKSEILLQSAIVIVDGYKEQVRARLIVDGKVRRASLVSVFEKIGAVHVENGRMSINERLKKRRIGKCE